MRILIIADYLPYPLTGGDRIRIYNLLCRVAQHHEVSLAAFLNEASEAEGAISHLRQFCVKVETASFQPRNRLSRIPNMVGYALAGKPPELSLLYSKELVSKIRELASQTDFDIVQIEHSRMGLYLKELPWDNNRKSLLMFHNFTSQQYGRVSQIEYRLDRKVRSWLNGIAMGRWEPLFAEQFNRCTTVSDEDRKLLLKANSRLAVDVIPNGVDTQKYQPLPFENRSPVLLFIGNMEYPPCVDAAIYFSKEILPRIRKKIPETEFWIVGRNPRSEVLNLNGDGILVTGRVDDVVPYYCRSAVSVVPLRAGGGTRLKILEAMALGRPVVSTTIGCEGLEVVDGKHLLIADTPDQFAEKVEQLLVDHQLCQFLAANGRRLVETYYDWNHISKRLMDVYSNLIKM